MRKLLAFTKASNIPLRVLPGEDGKSCIYRVKLTDEQRAMILQGADILVEILHFGGPLAPSRVMLLNQNCLTHESEKRIAQWFAAQTKGPYRTQL